MDDSKLLPEFVTWFNKLFSSENLTSFQKSYVTEFIEQKFFKYLDKDASSVTSRLFQKALMKIKFILTDTGGIYPNSDNLNAEELFAIGETGTDEWQLGVPHSVRKALRDIPDIKYLGGMPSYPMSGIADPADIPKQRRVRESSRKTILDMTPGLVALATSVDQSNIAKKPRPKKKPTLRTVVIQAMRTSRKNDEGLETFLEAAANDSIDSLTITANENEDRNGYKYEVSYDNGTETLTPKICAKSTINSWWTAAGKNQQ